jgi:hypothetical protein
MSKVLLHYRLHYLADCIWEQAKLLEGEGSTELSRELKEISGRLHQVAPKMPLGHALEQGQIG